MNILSQYMKWQDKSSAGSSKSKPSDSANDGSYSSTEEKGVSSDEEVLQKLFNASNGADNIKLYNGDTSKYKDDHSAADLAFVNKVAFYTQIPEQVDHIYRQSKLMRDKWDEVHCSATGETYGEMTINKALADLNDTYSPSSTGNTTGRAKSTSRAFRLIPGSEIIKHSIKTDWLIEGFIPADSTVLIFGEPESGKSLVVVEMACCIASGHDWTDKPVKQGEVVYIAGEGFNGLSKRLNALIQEKGLLVEHLHFSNSSMDLMHSDSVDEVLATVRNIHNLRLIIIDTLHRNFTGDESSSRDFAYVLKHCEQLRLATGATIMLVHHSGHGDKNRGRGSSSIKGGMDAEFKISNANGIINIHCTKMKEDEKPKDTKFNLKSLTIGEDDDGKPITAPILKKSTTFFTADTACESATPNPTEQQVLNALVRLTAEKNGPVPRPDWKAVAVEAIPVKADSKDPLGSKTKRFNRCVAALLDFGLVSVENDCFTVVGPDATTEGEGKQ
jgi:putative DNA primase/helicase